MTVRRRFYVIGYDDEGFDCFHSDVFEASDEGNAWENVHEMLVQDGSGSMYIELCECSVVAGMELR